MSAFKLNPFGMIGNLAESFCKNVFEKRVRPVPGSVLRCDLAGGIKLLGGLAGSVCHTGIYLGNDKIAEVSPVNGRAKVRIVDPDEFLSGDSDSINRTGAFVYVATDGDEALGSEEIAQRAKRMARRTRGKYKLLSNNCHMFTRYCVTGEDSDDMAISEVDIEEALCDEFGVSSISWKSTGFGTGDYSFDDVEYDEEEEEEEDVEDDDDEEED